MTASKQSIRKEKLRQREALPPQEHRALSRRVCDRLQDFLKQSGYFCVAAYIPTRGEPGIRRINEWLGSVSVRSLPVLGEDRILLFREWANGQELTPNRYGIDEPPGSAPLAPGELLFPDDSFTVLIPCVAFDRRGYRIGYGGGHYDATLRDLRARMNIRAIGVAFGFQEVPEIPYESFDERLNWVVTESDCFDCNS